MKKLILILSITYFSGIGVLCGQNEELQNKKWSLGINYMNLNHIYSNNPNYNFFGLSVEHIIYKRFFISAGIGFNRRKKVYYEMNTPLWGGAQLFDKLEEESRENNLIVPIDFKCYFSINKKKTIQAFAKLGIGNDYRTVKGTSKKYYGETIDEEKIDLRSYIFYTILGGGGEINFNPICIAVELLSCTGYSYPDNQLFIGRHLYDVGIKVSVNYSFY